MSTMPTTAPTMTTTTTRPKKRPASEDLFREQRLAKRLETLTLKPRTRRLSVVAEGDDEVNHGTGFKSGGSICSAQPPRKSRRASAAATAQHMEIDPTPHTIYIHSLDAELSEAESEDDLHHGSSLQTEEERAQTRNKLIFIPDIERKMTRIPDHVLRTGGEEYGPGLTDKERWERWEQQRRREWEREGKELVLYQNVPRTLSGGDDDGGTKRAIQEHKERVRRRLELGKGSDAIDNSGCVFGTERVFEINHDSMMDPGVGFERMEDGNVMMVDADGDVDMDA
ncbi:hypothetical protein EX30DRAFT_363470 [Ascodesmis nigricans]|uniref:Uncharacterized protein n=1 Tax=Ascodesmis nigricans TaxID=341454 RepID=A0A4S2MZ77_9PEZI|nr:hypothetical protein EX30DRAFT_363470 [Ascodesmis nigricans]